MNDEIKVSKGVSGQLRIPDTLFIIHYWRIEWAGYGLST